MSTDNIIALLEYLKDGNKLECVDGYIRYYYPVLAGLIVYYKEQVLIIYIKINMKCSICHFLTKERKFLM